MNWLKSKLLCNFNHDYNNSSDLIDIKIEEDDDDDDDDEFTKDEIKRICKWFHLNNFEEMERLTAYHFKNRWEGMLTERLAAMWTEMLFRDSGDEGEEKHVQLWEKLNWLMVKQHKAKPLKRASITMAILDPDIDILSTNKFIEYINDVMNSYTLMMEFCENVNFVRWTITCALPEANSTSSLRDYLFKDLKGKKGINVEELLTWIESDTVFKHILSEVCCLCVSLKPPARQLLPTPIYHKSWQSFINLGHLIFLSSQLDEGDTAEWRLLYSTNIHGGSLDKLFKHIRHKGPTILLIKDENQRIFGSFFSHPWTINDEFYGNEKCFLFTLEPKIDTFSPSGLNRNYQYCRTGDDMKNRGLGIGGTIGDFGIWLDEHLEYGRCSKECLTFKNYTTPTSEPEFKIANIQVWATRSKCNCKQNVESAISLEAQN